MRYFVCNIGCFGEYSERIKILNECLSGDLYELHQDAPWPSPLGQIQNGDTLLLKIQNQLVAWGLATDAVHVGQRDENGGWNRIVKVNKWRKHQLASTGSGIHHYGIQWATKPGAGQFAVVKEVEQEWAKQKIDAINNAASTINDDIGGSMETICQQQSLKELFEKPLYVPHYQRNFCWRKDNVIDFLETLRSRASVDNKSDTHLGSIILKHDDGHLSIVDGQQRLLTLTILAFCIKSPLKLGLLTTPIGGTVNDALVARKHLYWAQRTIDDWISRSGLKGEGLQSMLTQVRFTVVILPNENSEDLAYTFFNAVNSSGKKLSDYDLLKAHHLRFIKDEPVAEAMAERWDTAGVDEHNETLHRMLYRLRLWSRHEKPAINAQEEHRLFSHFSAKEPVAKGVFYLPLAVRFNSSIRGGAPFFHYAEQYRMQWQDFQKTEAYLSLIKHLSGHSGDVLRDSIRTVLFAFYCKFGRAYLEDALFCIADVISVLRNENQVRATAIHQSVLQECLVSLDAALDPGQFFDWCLAPERQYSPADTASPTKQRYWTALSNLYDVLLKNSLALKEQCDGRKKILKTSTN